jgi:hypothetical protein
VAEDLVRQGELGPEPAAAVTRLARSAERLHYARAVGEVGDLRADVQSVEAALAARAGRYGRLRARFLPASLARAAGSGLEALRSGARPARPGWRTPVPRPHP